MRCDPHLQYFSLSDNYTNYGDAINSDREVNRMLFLTLCCNSTLKLRLSSHIDELSIIYFLRLYCKLTTWYLTAPIRINATTISLINVSINLHCNYPTSIAKNKCNVLYIEILIKPVLDVSPFLGLLKIHTSSVSRTYIANSIS